MDDIDYEKAYKEALERAREMSKTITGANYEYIFPELKEDEDELTWLKNYISEEAYYLSMDIRDNEDRIKLQKLQKSLAWLEKQSERKSTDKIQIGKEYKCIASPRYSTFMSGKIYKPEDKFLCSFMNFCSDCFEPIEDSEQIDLASNTDKLEPNFKHGDRVRNKKTGLEQTLGSCIEDVYEGAFPFRIKDQDEWELVKQTPADKVEPKFKVGDIVQYITDSTDRRKIEEVDTLCNMYHTDSSPIMFEIEDEWKVVVNAEDVEQKPTDKIEPKFHEGDTIVEKDFFECDYETIKEIKDGKYIFTDGSTMNINEQDGWLFVKPHTVIEQNLTKKYGITGIGSKHAEGKLGEMIKKKIETEKV